MKYKIGKTISVIGDTISVLLDDFNRDENGRESGVPISMSINYSSDVGPTPLLIGQPGSFIDISIPTGSLLCMVTEVRMIESFPTTSEIKDAAASYDYVMPFLKRILAAIAIGTIDNKDKFERGSDVLPTVGTDVFAVPSETIEKVYSSYSEGNFSIGKLSVLPNQEAQINLDMFLSRHGAILGQTGSGKSWTIASLLQKIAVSFKKSSVVLLDLHGEYKNAFGNYANYISAEEIELPYWLMNSEEIIEMCVDRHESAAPNQIAKFKELLQVAKENHNENKNLNIPKITIDTPVYFDFNYIIDEFKRLDTAMVTGARGDKQGPLFGQFTRLLMRLESRLNDKRYDLIFKPKTYTSSASMEQLFKRILGEEEEPKKIVIMDLSPVPFEVRTSVISLVLRCLFDFCYWYKRKNNKSYALAVFADEAHAYLNDSDINHKPSRLSAERIAKEGRKYGISLTVISQRPREVSSTILSQCNSFLCLRITNPDDQSYIKNLLPDSIKGIVDILSTLRRGECILLGDAVLMPTRIKIEKPNPKPDSDDVSFTKEWNQDLEPIDIAAILDLWRRQGIENE